MKILYVLMIVFLFSCNKNKNNEPTKRKTDNWVGSVTYNKNNILTNGKIKCTLNTDNTLKLEMVTFLHPTYNVYDDIVFDKIPLTVQTDSLVDGNNIALPQQPNGIFYIFDIDVLDSYFMQTNQRNYLTITSYDATTKTIQGSFNSVFYKDSISYKNTITYSNGSFTTKVL